MTDALVGHTGLVGSNLARQHAFPACFNSTNIGDIAGRQFDLLVFAGAQSKKWWANANPEEDRRGIERAVDALAAVRARKTVLISTVDVIPAGRVGADESIDCTSERTHPYGENRLWLEQVFRRQYPDCLVVRLPGLFGPALKKNVIYDLLTDNQLEKVNPASRFQYYDLTRLWPDIDAALRADLELLHLFTEPIETATVIARCFPGKHVGSDAAPAVAYDFRTRHGRLFGGDGRYVEGAASVMNRLAAFVEAVRRNAAP